MKDYLLAYRVHRDKTYDTALYLENDYRNIASFVSKQTFDNYLFTDMYDRELFTTMGCYFDRFSPNGEHMRNRLVSELNAIHFNEKEPVEVKLRDEKVYSITFTETLERTVDIYASTADEARNAAEKMYSNEEVVLGAEDFVNTEIDVEETKLNVLIVRPGQEAFYASIDNDYYTLRDTVDGLIERTFPFEDAHICVISNDNAIAEGLLPNRGFKDDNGNINVIYFGNMIVCAVDKQGELTSLTKEQADFYKNELRPQTFFSKDSGAVDFKIKTEKMREER